MKGLEEGGEGFVAWILNVSAAERREKKCRESLDIFRNVRTLRLEIEVNNT